MRPTNRPRSIASAASDGWLHLLLDERLLAVDFGSDVTFSLAVPHFSAGSSLRWASAGHLLVGRFGYRYQALTRTLGNGHEFAAGKLNGAQFHISHAVLARQRAHLIMQVQSGLLSAREAARQLQVSRKTYYKWERRALAAMVEALSNRLPCQAE